MNDSEILKKLKDRDEQALTHLMDRYVNYVSAILCNMTGQFLTEEDIEELVADVFLSIWNSSERLEPGRPVKPYLAQITRNAAIGRLRKMKHVPVPFDDDLIVISKEGNPDELAVKKEQAEIINDSVKSFGEPDREIFIRFYYMGERIEAIGNRLGINQATIKTKLHRCRKRLKAVFEERGYRYE